MLAVASVLALASNTVALSTSASCHNGTVLSELMLIATLYFKNR